VGTQALAELEEPTGGGFDTSCAYTIELANRHWSIEGGPEHTSQTGDLDRMPVVFGLFSGLDLRSPGAPTIAVTTTVHDTKTTVRQTIAWIIAFAGLVAALLLLAVPALPRDVRRRLSSGLARAAAHSHPTDAVVAIALIGWWIVAPVIWDDGWVVARERTFSASGGFSIYYNVFGADLPLDYWVEWLHHWLAERTSVVLDLRAHALVVLGVMWVLCRWGLRRVTAASPGRWDPSVWALATAFLVGAMAWDMAIRPEPVVALLATGVAACAIRFVERETVASLAAAALLVPLALAAHHTGVVALAPVVAVSPRLVRWARARIAAMTAIVIASLSWCVVLAFVGSDAGQRIADAKTTRTYSISSSWRNEIDRYSFLNGFPWATPLRRASVALIALGLLAFVTRRRRSERGLSNLPATMLTISLVLFLLTPSKHPWHFGALTGLTALTIGAEVTRFRRDESEARGWRLRPFLAIGASVLAAAWAWYPRDAWNPVDLRTLSWTQGPDARFPFTTLAIVLPVLILGGAMLLARRRRAEGPRLAWSVAAWAIPLAVVPMILFTVVVLTEDMRRTNGWTLTRQNVDSIVGRSGCGLADDAVASLPGSARSLQSVGAVSSMPPAWVPAAPVPDLERFVLEPSKRATPWFRLPDDGRFGLFAAASAVTGGQLALDWGRQDGKARVDEVRADPVGDVVPRIETTPWTFVAASELPVPAPGADVVRMTTTPSTVPRAPLAVTAPVDYEAAPLSHLLAGPEASVLIHPALFLYFPCARQPTLADGVVEVPRYFLWFDNGFQPHPYEPTSPFLGVHDLYSVQRVPLTDGLNPPSGVVLYEIERQIAGGKVLSPESRTDAS